MFAAEAQTMDHSAVYMTQGDGYITVRACSGTDFTERTKLPGWLWLSRMRKDPSPCEVRRALARLLEISPW